MAHLIREPIQPAADTDVNALLNKQTLALDALSKLTWHFAQKPDCHQLLDMFVLTMAGQFSSSSAFAAVRNPKANLDETLFVGTGRYAANRQLADLLECDRLVERFRDEAQPVEPTCGDCQKCGDDLKVMVDENIALAAPLIHGEELIGIVGLGPKVTGKPFDASEIDLLATLTNTIAPFIANSFLFMEIAHLNAWYLEILNSVRQRVFVFGSSEGLKTVNSAGRTLLEHYDICSDDASFEDLLGASLIDVFPEHIFPGWTRQFLNTYDERQDRVIKNMVARDPEGERIYNVHVTTLNQNDKFDSGLVVTLDDITAQKESEERLFNLEKFADKGVMAASISHELNNFLGLILGGVELTQMALQRGKTDKALKSLEKISANGARMKRFTAGLMDYTKLETSKRNSDLNAVIVDVLSFLRMQNKFKSIRIQTELDTALPTFDMDKDQIAQLLLNMLNNAADAIAETGRSDGRIVLTTEENDDFIGLTVADNGAGIPPEVKDQLFRTHLTTKDSGHGYGLVTCAKIIESHRAEFDIVSEVGQGATFNFRFPTKT